MAGAREAFTAALRLGLASFGGPIAHLGYFRTEYVERRRWLNDAAYAELVAVAQFLPGPASSQVGMAVGYTRAGLPGALASWVGFTLPSAVVMAAFGALAAARDLTDQVWLAALKLVAVAVVLDAVIGMARRLTTTLPTAAIAVATGAALLLLPASGLLQVGCLLAAAALGLVLFRRTPPAPDGDLPLRVGRRTGAVCLALFGALFLALPLLGSGGTLGQLAAGMYRAGGLVFGGGHVVLPLLEAETVPDLVSQDQFLAGYGLAQALPGPLFTFGTYLGQVAAGLPGALVATVFLFLPGFLVLLGVLPFWQTVRGSTRVQAALVGVNAAVVGLLGAALLDPIVVEAISAPVDVLFAAALFVALRLAHLPPWAVVVGAVVASPLLAW